ncbi:hypothetical protein FDP41_003957 [Naegleria fowleri]|uniref:BTB domain-containing protein n=1 Tax=Naegleria fowleri TaxID=5763 RepID=A0A6A5BSW5_NAEFO|nr:uncharacterized protein FDP41_003957 [Naegleria fowleri]KAF0977304.1 hypothetical protein FDP41_003957 [Naegleria fowleri]CAG4708141.1 unnamed protein product [Naegleria fowleri]
MLTSQSFVAYDHNNQYNQFLKEGLQCQEFISSQPVNALQQQLIFSPSEQVVHPQPIIDSIVLQHILPSEHDDDHQLISSYQWTITFRLKLHSDASGDWRCLFHYGNTDLIRQPALWLSPYENTLHCRVDTTLNNNEGFDSNQRLNNYQSWYHVALVYYDTYQILYVDGKCDQIGKFGGVLKRTSNQTFRIFASPGGYSQGDVEVKYFRMYNRALSPNDIQIDMKSDKPLTTSSVPMMSSYNTQSCDRLLKQDLKKMLNMHEFSNVLLKFSETDQVIRANDIMLSARSEYFRKVLSKEWNDSNGVEFTPTRPKVIEMQGLSYQAVKAVVHYIYTGELDNELKDNTGKESTIPVLLEILKTGNLLLLTDMEHLVTDVLTSKIDTKNVCTILNEIYVYQVTSLNTFCLEYIVRHFKIIPIDDFLKLDQETQKQILVGIQMSK